MAKEIPVHGSYILVHDGYILVHRHGEVPRGWRIPGGLPEEAATSPGDNLLKSWTLPNPETGPHINMRGSTTFGQNYFHWIFKFVEL